MNQGKLEMVKQEMARVKINILGIIESRQIGSSQTGDSKTELNILGIRELKWTGMGKFNSDDHYIYY